jgi:hypothetical protein
MSLADHVGGVKTLNALEQRGVKFHTIILNEDFADSIRTTLSKIATAHKRRSTAPNTHYIKMTKKSNTHAAASTHASSGETYLSELATTNVVRYYADDFHIIARLRALSCGLDQNCLNGLRAIIGKYYLYYPKDYKKGDTLLLSSAA